jgi:membrane fusion protein (multidrug efflux system)
MNAAVLDRETTVAPISVPRGVKLRRIGIFAAASLVAVAVLGYGVHWFNVGRFMERTDDAYVGGDITIIAPKVAGFISEVAVTDNQQVAAGDLLVKIDDRDYRAALARAEAGVEAQRAGLANLDATRRLQQSVIAQARARVAASDAEVRRAHDDDVRFRDLAAHAAASIQVSQKAEADYKQAVAQSQGVRAALEGAQRQLDVIDTQKRQTEAAIAEARAAADLATLNVGYTELRAPIAGVVGNRSARNGSFAAVGTQLISIIPADGLWIDANFKESQISQARAGLEATITADVLPGEVFHGHVVSLAPATGAQFSVLPPENATGNFTKIVQRVPVRIRLDGDGARLGRLRPGLSVTASFDTRAPQTAPTVAKVLR